MCGNCEWCVVGGNRLECVGAVSGGWWVVTV